MSRHEWSGADLLEALRHATATLIAEVDDVNALNVFPVPDGDTGSNMVATVGAALDEALNLAEAERSVPRVAAAFSFGALMGARGNSGVILSQLFRGLSAAVQEETVVGPRQLARALQAGRDAAYAAVATPVEGTMLTVATDVAATAERVAAGDVDIETLLLACAESAAESVARTPTLLPLLAQAGVVDAGGRGLELLLLGALGFAQGKGLPTVVAMHDVHLPDFSALEEEGFGYETVYVVSPADGARLDIDQIRNRLGEMGESVLVAGDERAVKIHIHNERPDEVLAYGLSLGTLSRIVVENLDRQARNIRDAGAIRRSQAIRLAPPPTALENALRTLPTGSPAVPIARARPAGPAVVAVAAGHGLARLFADNGVAAVVEGGQSANPSTGDLIAAIRGTGSDEVLLLPNNSNVRLAAQQAGELLPDISLEVVPTRNAAEGVAALLALDTRKGLADNAKRMARAATDVQTLQVTAAVRDARIGDTQVKRGDHICLDPDDGLLSSDADRTAAVIAALQRLEPGFELITVYHGEGVDAAEAEQLRLALAAALPEVDFELVDGGQPHYSLLISAE